MLKLDHITVIAPSLQDGVSHVRSCLDMDVPFGQRHEYMGTHNHLLQLGGGIYLEIVALDPNGEGPDRRRWFGLDDQEQVRSDWNWGRRLRSWVARTDDMDDLLAEHSGVFGRKIPLPMDRPVFDFAIPDDGSLPLGGALPSVIDRRGKLRSMDNIADLGATLKSFTLEHPEAQMVQEMSDSMEISGGPVVIQGDTFCYIAEIETPTGIKTLT